MTDKQKEAIETLFHLEHINGYVNLYEKHDVIIKSDILLKWKNATKEALNLIQTQQAEIEKKDKIIDETIDYIYTLLHGHLEYINNDIAGDKGKLKQYFERKLENGN